jgi:hypothetical protein
VIRPPSGDPSSTFRPGVEDVPVLDGAPHISLPAEVTRLRGELSRFRDELAAATEHSANLEAALATNRRIGMAIGILMATRKVAEEAAFDALRDASMQRNEKLRDVAEDVIHTGTLE